MHRLLDLLTRFKNDERGAFAMIFAVMAIALIAMSGAAVDFTVIQQARTRAQVALDAAALALQPSIYTDTSANIQANAQALLVNRLADAVTTWSDCTKTSPVNKAPCATVIAPTIDTTNGVLTLTANIRIPMYFVAMVGVQNVPAQIISVSTRKKLQLEVAMVLDNSGSMYYSMGYNSHVNNTLATRMQTLQSSATCATNILFYGVTTCSASTTGLTANASVKIGLVPFTQAVNVGYANKSATWLDRTGTGNITDNNFDNDDNTATTFAGSVDRIALIEGLKDSSGTAIKWGGCVEARKSPYDTDDTTPVSTSPDTMFTPYMAPDEPGDASATTSIHGGSYSNSYISDTTSTACKKNPTVVWTSTKSKCSSQINTSRSNSQNETTFSGLSCTNATTNTYAETDQNGTASNPSSLPSTIYNNPVPSDYVETFSTSGTSGNYTNVQTRTYYYLSDRVLQERMCKYTGAQLTSAVSASSVFGPNGDCPAAAIQPLTGTPATVITAINAMTPNGGTNITEGAAWGFRVLSPTAPFTEGGAYSTSTSKVMILMTDGENTIYPGTNMNYDTFYSAYGYPYNTRLVSPATSTDTTLEAQMNARLYSTVASGISNVCRNARAQGITIYTIGVDVADTSDPTGNTALLTNCASATSDAYFPNTASDLQAAFVAIANQLAALRLSK